MHVVADLAPDVSPLPTAALLLAALPHLRALDLPAPSAAAVLDRLGAGRSRAYQLKARLEALLPELVGPTGRPPVAKPEPAPAQPAPALATSLLRYLVDHPGAISGGPGRHRYSDGVRLLILDLLERHRDLPLEACAEALALPLGTLKDWLRGEMTAVAAEPSRTPMRIDPTDAQLQTLLAEWDAWQGSFVAFCDHVQLHCRLPFGRALIATLLEGHGVRQRRRRDGRSPDESALRGAFLTFFPHAQWVGDGSQVPIEVNGELLVFNVELDVDAYSGAFVGADVSLVENSDAIVATFRDAIDATGVRPLAVLLDNNPCNHTDEVVGELEPTLSIRATKYRPQNKAHVEGGYGLLKPTLAGLALQFEGSLGALARSFLENLVIAACRAINHRPRRDRGGRSRVDLLGDAPTPEQVDEARRSLAALRDKQLKARETLAARQDPVVRALLATALTELALADPEGHFLTAIARYPLGAVVEGLAVFEAKVRAGTLPPGVDVRYLLGIVRNIASEREAWALAEALWARRVLAGDLLARQLEGQRQAIAREVVDTEQLVVAYLDRALGATARLERHFWLNVLADLITAEPDLDHHRLFRLAARRTAATHAVPTRDRNAAIRFLAAKVRPLA